MNYTLVVMTLNEIDGMKVIMPRIKRDWFEQILIVDGGSTDGTIEWSRDNGYEVFVQSETGLRQGCLEALPKIRAEVIITFSPDGNSIPELLPKLISKIEEGYDMVVVSRYLDGAKSEDDDFVTAFGNWFFTNTVNILFGAKYTDVLVMYRGYRKSLINELELNKDQGFLGFERFFQTRLCYVPVLACRAARRGLKVAEIPGDEPARISGERKLQIFRWGAAYYLQFLREFFTWK